MSRRFKAKRRNNHTIIKIIIVIIIVYFLFYKILLTIKEKANDNMFYLFLANTFNIDVIDLKVNPLSLLDSAFNKNTTLVFKSNEEEVSTPVSTEYFEDPNKVKVEEPLIYIYNTHQLEEYSMIEKNDYDKKPNVLMASYMLKEKLNNLDIPTIVEENDITEVLRINSWKYKYSYKASRIFLEDTMNKHPSIKLFIDLHRDSSKREKTITTIDGKIYARILWIVGLENSSYQKNLDLTLKLNDMINKVNPTLSRGIYKKSGPGVNGIYNQDLRGNIVLLEMGAQYNTIDEINNTLDLISGVLKEYIEGLT